jgi:hypothetical protein
LEFNLGFAQGDFGLGMVYPYKSMHHRQIAKVAVIESLTLRQIFIPEVLQRNYKTALIFRIEISKPVSTGKAQNTNLRAN